jgi:hypothetical protein
MGYWSRQWLARPSGFAQLSGLALDDWIALISWTRSAIMDFS